MNCKSCNEKLVIYGEGLLSEPEAEEVVRHLETCPACRAAWEAHRSLHERLLRDGETFSGALSGAGLEGPVMDRILKEQTFKLRARGKTSPRIRRIRNAAALVAAVLVMAMLLYHYHSLQTVESKWRERNVTGPAVVNIHENLTEQAPAVQPGVKVDDWRLGKGYEITALDKVANRVTRSKPESSQPGHAGSKVVTAPSAEEARAVNPFQRRNGVYNSTPADSIPADMQTQMPEMWKNYAKGRAVLLDRFDRLGYVENNSAADTTVQFVEGLDIKTAIESGAFSHLMGEDADAFSNLPELRTKLGALGYVAADSSSFGFSVGGAKDILNFRKNIEKGFLPAPTDVTYEGLFYDYYFDTGDPYPCDDLFYPSYSAAVTKDPFSGREDYYLTVGLNSGLKKLERKRLNLVIVLDVSGSMKEVFDRYHYDSPARKDTSADMEKVQKIEVAKTSLLAVLDHLNPEDRFGMVIFRDQAHLAKPLRLIGETDMDAVRGHIKALKADGATNMSSGMRMASDLFKSFTEEDPGSVENRIIYLTDAQINRGELSEAGLLGMAKQNAEDGIFTSFIGIGVDFNSELVEAVTKMRGANYYSVHTGEAFERRMKEEFVYMVTPLVFDLELVLESGGYKIEKVFGSPMADAATGTLMKINTLFPSPSKGGETRGGVVLLKLTRKPEPRDDAVYLRVRYKDRLRQEYVSSRTIRFAAMAPEHFDNTGVQKAVLLTRYASLLKGWLIDARMAEIAPGALVHSGDYFLITPHKGIVIAPPVRPRTGRWERQSRPLQVNQAYRHLFGLFKTYFENEMEALSDDTLKQEVEVLERLLKPEEGAEGP